ncbi:hypothetical protein CHS0354_003097 [Potamilus streckersoni]|uniref:Uncharacterized protein n=1 Tax=Potamilus streckersoni TaxID=2493646 RepID=A0AAE0RPA3_9BIVA|nr:hypothetical protein CHS0354_003097 [Potamilus streckersoni]
MSTSSFIFAVVFTCTMGLAYGSYSSTYGSSYKGVQTGGILYQQVPVPVYKPVPVPVTLSKGVGGYGFVGFPGSFGGFGGGDFISSTAMCYKCVWFS